jgi:PTH1 family peptidyl-tRNA hydrolase
MKLVFGLGNPGVAYTTSRHNAGFMALGQLSDRLGIPITRKKRNALVGEGTVEGGKVMLVLPQTYMNRSGDCVLDFAAFFKVQPEDIVIVYDDVDLPTGTVRVRLYGGPGTHNGMRDIVSKIMSEDFPRVRIGIGTPPPGWDLADYVLARPNEEDAQLLSRAAMLAAEAVHCLIKEGPDAAMRFNEQGKPEKPSSA